MTTVRPMPSAGMRPNSMLGYDIDRAIARFESELATHRLEEARLRRALARAEALLLERVFSVPEAAEAAGRRVYQGQFSNRDANLTPRQYEIMKLVLDGHPSKNIAADLGISRRTVENHRAAIMKKTGSKSLPALGRFGIIASTPIAPDRAGDAFATTGATSRS